MTEVYNKEALKEVAAEDLLALDFDQIEDVREFVNLPSGVYVGVITNMECKTSDSGAQWWEVEINVAEHVEGASDEDLAGCHLEEGEYTIKYMWFNERIPYFKKAFAGAASAVGAANASELFEKLTGQGVQFTHNLRSWKEKGTGNIKHGNELKLVTLIEA